jgi:hypothetical protein
MRVNVAAVGLILATVLIGIARAQERPNLTGRWVPAGSDSQPVQPLVVTQTATSITVKNWSTSGPSSGMYQWNLDPEPATTITPSASWKDDTLVVIFTAGTWTTAPKVNGTRTESWAIDRSGKLSVAVVVRRDQGAPIVDRFVFTRDDRQTENADK